MTNELKPALLLIAIMAIFTGLVYPLTVTGIAQVLFPVEADGSLIERNGDVIGSSLIAQDFDRPEYFHPRPSMAGEGYEADNSGASNLGATSAELLANIESRAQQAQALNGRADEVPQDLVTASASGLDPHISPDAAAYQMPRVAKARGLGVEVVEKLVREHTEPRQFVILGQPRVNVLLLNLALDELAAGPP